MTDPTTLPDDHVAAGRAYALALQRDAEEALGRLTQERDRLAADLGQERALRVMREEELRVAVADSWCDVCCGKGDPGTGVPCMCGGTGLVRDAVNYLRVELVKAQAVAEAVKALATQEQWFWDDRQALFLRSYLFGPDAIARALVAAGLDWREPKEATP